MASTLVAAATPVETVSHAHAPTPEAEPPSGLIPADSAHPSHANGTLIHFRLAGYEVQILCIRGFSNYAGEEFVPHLGQYYNRARYLDVERGRFWSRDEFEGINPGLTLLDGGDHELSVHHLYMYARGNSVGRVDPSGYEDIASLGAAISINNSFATTVISIQGKSIVVADKNDINNNKPIEIRLKSSARELTVFNPNTGETFMTSAFTGGFIAPDGTYNPSPVGTWKEGGPLPTGNYYIHMLDLTAHNIGKINVNNPDGYWFKVSASANGRDWMISGLSRRTGFRLHLGTRSLGRITINAKAVNGITDWRRLMNMLLGNGRSYYPRALRGIEPIYALAYVED
jgi:RHS repeat-associated protein